MSSNDLHAGFLNDGSGVHPTGLRSYGADEHLVARFHHEQPLTLETGVSGGGIPLDGRTPRRRAAARPGGR
jgi:hypothetical protein